MDSKDCRAVADGRPIGRVSCLRAPDLPRVARSAPRRKEIRIMSNKPSLGATSQEPARLTLADLPPLLAEHFRAVLRESSSQGQPVDLLEWLPFEAVPRPPILDDLDDWRAAGAKGYEANAAEQLVRDCNLFDASELKAAVLKRYLAQPMAALSESRRKEVFTPSRNFVEWLASQPETDISRVQLEGLRSLRRKACVAAPAAPDNGADVWHLRREIERFRRDPLGRFSSKSAKVIALASTRIVRLCGFRECGEINAAVVRLALADYVRTRSDKDLAIEMAKRYCGLFKAYTKWRAAVAAEDGQVEADPLAELTASDCMYDAKEGLWRLPDDHDDRPAVKRLMEYRLEYRHRLETGKKIAGRDDSRQALRLIMDCGYQELRAVTPEAASAWIRCQDIQDRTRDYYFWALRRCFAWCFRGRKERNPLADWQTWRETPSDDGPSCPDWAFDVLPLYEDHTSDDWHNPKAFISLADGNSDRIIARLGQARDILWQERYDEATEPRPLGSKEIVFELFGFLLERLNLPKRERAIAVVRWWDALPDKIIAYFAGRDAKTAARLPQTARGTDLVRQRARKGSTRPCAPSKGQRETPQNSRLLELVHGKFEEMGRDTEAVANWFKLHFVQLSPTELRELCGGRIRRPPDAKWVYRRVRAYQKWMNGRRGIRGRERSTVERNLEFLTLLDRICLKRRGRVLTPKERYLAEFPGRAQPEHAEGAHEWNANRDRDDQVKVGTFATGAWKAFCELHPVEALPILQGTRSYETNKLLLHKKREFERAGKKDQGESTPTADTLDWVAEESNAELRDSIGRPKQFCGARRTRTAARRRIGSRIAGAAEIERIEELAAAEAARRAGGNGGGALAGGNGDGEGPAALGRADKPAGGNGDGQGQELPECGPQLPNVLRCEDGSYELDVPPTPFHILQFLWGRMGRSVELRELSKAVWGKVGTGYGTMKPHVSKLNRALIDAGAPFEVTKQRGQNFVRLCRIRI